MSTQNELAVVPPKGKALQVFQTPKGLDPYLKVVRDKIDAFVPDVTTRKGREAIASIAYTVARSKTALDNRGKELVAELKEIPKLIDAERKRMRDTLDAWQEEVRRPLTEWQAAEDARVDRHNDRIEWLRGMPLNLAGQTSVHVEAIIAEVEAVEIGEQWEEFEAEAARAKDLALKALREILTELQRYESEQAELAKLRAESEARAKADHEAAIARAAAERAQQEAAASAQAERDAAAKREQALIDKAAADKRAAEQAIKDAEAAAANQALQLKLAAEQAERQKLQAEADRVAAEQRAEQQRIDAEKRQAEAVERARQQEVERQAAAVAFELEQAKAREADQAHKIKVMGAAKEALIGMNISEELAKAIVLKICRREVPHVTINF